MKSTVLGLAALIAASLPQASLGNDLPAIEQFSGTTVEFKLNKLFGVITLTVAGPNGFNAGASARSTSPVIDLRRVGPFDEGTYHYQLTGSTDEKVPVRTALDNGRSGGPTNAKLKDVSLGGRFLVKGGTIVKASTAPPTRLDKDAR
jgi:hypothetical protein